MARGEIRGSPVHQVQVLYEKSGIKAVGESKHEAKSQARDAGARTWQDIGAALRIHSYATADAYRDVWVMVLKYAKKMGGVTRIERLEGQHVRAFLESKIDQAVARATFAQYAAACAKLEKALKMYAARYRTGRVYDFRSDIQAAKRRAAGLRRFNGSRAYEMPEELVAAVKEEDHMDLLAHVQLETGVRCREVCTIREDQLAGVHLDPVRGEDRGWITVQAKGGKRVAVAMSVQTYKKLTQAIKDGDGKIQVRPNRYQTAIREAAIATKQVPKGTHGLRWNYAQRRYKEAAAYYHTDEAAKGRVSLDMGHNRVDITGHYFKKCTKRS